MKWVLDASVALKLLVPEDQSLIARSLLGDVFMVPDIFFSECVNVLWKKVARKQLAEQEAVEALALLTQIEVRVFDTKPLMPHALLLAIQLNHPAYDCFYLVLAEHQDAPLITADKRLFTRCQQPDVARWAGCVRLLGAHVTAA